MGSFKVIFNDEIVICPQCLKMLCHDGAYRKEEEIPETEVDKVYRHIGWDIIIYRYCPVCIIHKPKPKEE